METVSGFGFRVSGLGFRVELETRNSELETAKAWQRGSFNRLTSQEIL